MRKGIEKLLQFQVIRYFINGLIATLIHFTVLQINLIGLGMETVGLANFIAAIFGITASFFGSRYFVYQTKQESIIRQFSKFSGLYAAIAFLHGLVLYSWSDIQGWDYRSGFIVATALQVVFSYWGNKLLVFKE